MRKRQGSQTSDSAMTVEQTISLSAIEGLNSSSRLFAAQYALFLSLLLYVVFVVFVTDHRILLLSESLVLPIVDISVPVNLFYATVPFFIAFVFVNLVVHLHVLLNKARALDRIRLAKEFPGQADLVEVSITSSPYLHPTKYGIAGKLPRAILSAFFYPSLLVAPLSILLLLQWRFIPYHSPLINFIQACSILVYGLGVWLFAHMERMGAAVYSSLSCFASLGAIISFCFCGLPSSSTPWDDLPWKLVPNAIMFEGSDTTTPRPLFRKYFDSRNLDAAGMLISSANVTSLQSEDSQATGDCSKLPVPRATSRVLLAGRNFENANFSGATFVGIDFASNDTNLRGADFSDSNLSSVSFSDAELSGANFEGACLNQVFLSNVRADGAKFSNAQMYNSYFSNASFVRSNWEGARIIQTVGSGARFQTSSMSGLLVLNSDLRSTNFDGVSLANARLLDVDLEGSSAAGLDLSYANLIKVEAAKLSAPGVVFDHADIWFSNFRSATLSASTFRDTAIWRTRFLNANLDLAYGEQVTIIGSDFSGVDQTLMNFGTLSQTESGVLNQKGAAAFFSAQLVQEEGRENVIAALASVSASLSKENWLQDDVVPLGASLSDTAHSRENLKQRQADYLGEMMCGRIEVACSVLVMAQGSARSGVPQFDELSNVVRHKYDDSTMCKSLKDRDVVDKVLCKGTKLRDVFEQF